MVAVISIPGASDHRWERFHSRKDAQAWIDKEWDNRGHHTWPGDRILTEKEASKIRYQDGTRVYRR